MINNQQPAANDQQPMKNNPYIGPRPFERSDRDRFFGRAREMRDLLSLIMAERVVLFYAQSGAGKTSLLNTQIVPALEEEGFKVLPIARVGSGAPRGVDAASIKNLFVFSALLTLAGPQGDSDLLHQQTLKSFLASIADDEHPPIVIFDQFEELLTTHRARWEDARGFFEQLRDALQAIPRLGVVLAMREDHVAGLDPYAALLPKRLKTRFRMELLGYDGALEAVRKPAQNTGCAYGTGVAERLVDDLRRIQVTANSTETSNGALGAYVEPVQLQVVCRRLWDNLPEREERIITWSEIEQFGDIDRALTDFYESVLQHTAQETPVSERQLRRWFATELITPMKTRGLALRGEHGTNGLSNEAVDVLDRQHLIRAEARAGAYWYELAHDRLVEPIVTSNAAYDQAHLTSLRITAQKWQQSKNADLLYSGSVLVDAIRFTRTHPYDIEDYEHEFLAASTQAQRVKARNRIIRLSVIAALSVGMIIMAALAVLAFQSKQEADQQRRVAVTAQAQAETQRQSADAARATAVADANARAAAEAQAVQQSNIAKQQYRAALSSQIAGQAQLSLNDFPQRSLLLAVEALSVTLKAGEPRVPASENALREVLARAGSIPGRILPDAAYPATFSSDGRWLATTGCDETQPDKCHAHNVLLWDMHDKAVKPIVLHGHTDVVQSLAFSPDGHWLASGSWDDTVRLWNVSRAAPALDSIELPAGEYAAVWSVAFSPDGHWLMADGHTTGANLWDMTAAYIPASRRSLPAYPKGLAVFSSDGQYLAIHGEGHVEVWNIATSNPTGLLPKNGDWSEVTAVTFISNTHQLIAATCRDNCTSSDLTLWNLDDLAGEPVILSAQQGLITALVADGNRLLTIRDDLTIEVWDVTGPNPNTVLARLRGAASKVNVLTFSPDRKWLAGVEDKTVWLWNMSSPTDAPIALAGNAHPVTQIEFNPDGHWLTTASCILEVRDDCMVTSVWLWEIGNPRPEPVTLSNAVRFDFSPDGQWLVTGTGAKLWDMTTIASAPVPLVLSTTPQGFDGFSPDGRWLATDGGMKLWDMTTITSTSIPLVLTATQSVIAFSPDGHWLAASGDHGPSHLWDMSKPGNEPIALNGVEMGVSVMAFSPNSRWLAVGNDDGTLRLRDTTQLAGQPLDLPGHQKRIQAIAFSPDGHWLSSASDDGTTRLWSVDQIHAEPIVLHGHEAGVSDAVFSPDSRWLATVGCDKEAGVVIFYCIASTVRVWNMGDQASLSAVLRGHANRLTAVTFSPDGQYIAAGESCPFDADSACSAMVLVWNRKNPLTSIAPIVLHGDGPHIVEIAFSPDGSWLAMASMNDYAAGSWVSLWRMNVPDLIDLACRAAGRNLTSAEWQQYFPDQPYRTTCDQWPSGQ
ncbi:putative serine/threonine-protein kinase PkwA [Thermoflexales bacterium]|nr:putative serine/threonine-protein kinase PkwA [Thermoflexales bacterium]